MSAVSKVVRIPFERLVHGDSSLQVDIARAFGAGGLGLLTVSGVHGYAEARQRLLQLVPRLVDLPEAVLKQYEDPDSTYSFGWSHGKEALKSGKRDRFKGSFYANPLVDTHGASPEEVRRYPGYLRPNVWPSSHLPELEPAFKHLAKIIIDTGLLLMDQCDRYVQALNPGAQQGRLRRVLECSTTHKARLLHYFPPDASSAPGKHGQAGQADRSNDLSGQQDQEWCGWHTDHGSLTGLTAAMYTRGGEEVASPDPQAGLYARDRSQRVVQVSIPVEDIAFQVGESLQVHSGGLLQATPHYVRAASGPGVSGISRNTFAVFLQPGLHEPLDAPPGASQESVGVGQWRPGMEFGQFANATLGAYYQ